MILAINYSDARFRPAQILNSKCARKFGADKVIEYTYDKLPDEFKERFKDRFQYRRGGGYWIWKPYIILDALSKVQDGDYVVYTDAGSAFVNKIQYLIDAMNREQTDIMAFCIEHLEKYYTKRDAFILMECDRPEITDTPQIVTGYIIVRKNPRSVAILQQFMNYEEDDRIVTDQPNVMGKENYEGFVENRHDQTVWSLLCKMNGIKPFRDPSEWGVDRSIFSEEVNKRSSYPQIIESHRNPNLHSIFQLKYKKWYKYLNLNNYKKKWKSIMKDRG